MAEMQKPQSNPMMKSSTTSEVKRNSKPFALLSLVLMTAFFSSQSQAQKSDSLGVNRFIITTSVFEFFPALKLNTINCNIGAEIYFKKRNALNVNIGLLRPSGIPGQWYSINAECSEGFKAQLEGRHFLNKHKINNALALVFKPHFLQGKSEILPNSGYYISIHSALQHTLTKRKETLTDHNDTINYQVIGIYKDNIYTVFRNAIALNLKVGYQCIRKHGFTIDFAVGLGVQLISSHSVNRLDPTVTRMNREKEWPFDKVFDTGSGIFPNIIYQMRLGWAI